MHDYPGLWIVLEGMDGSGTTTTMYELAKRIGTADKWHPLSTTCEPTMRKHGRRIREMLLAPKKDIMLTGEELMNLFVLDRYDHVNNQVVPDLRNGKIVLQDRYNLSTLAYQGVLQGMPIEQIVEMHRFLPIIPDAILLFQLELQEAERRTSDGAHKEAFDDLDKQRKSHEAYAQLPAIMKKHLPKYPLHVIDANRSPEEVANQCMEIVNPVLPYPYRTLEEKLGR
ncbi:MAG: dTMP kinase [Candidatus Nanoarchaeia archaeon]